MDSNALGRWPTPLRDRDPEAATDSLRDIIGHGSRRSASFEGDASPARCARWFEPIVAWHEAEVSTGPTKGMNNLFERGKRDAFGFNNFESFRNLALLYADKPIFRVLDSIAVS